LTIDYLSKMTEAFTISDGRRNRDPENDAEHTQWVEYLIQQGAKEHAKQCIKLITDGSIRANLTALLK